MVTVKTVFLPNCALRWDRRVPTGSFLSLPSGILSFTMSTCTVFSLSPVAEPDERVAQVVVLAHLRGGVLGLQAQGDGPVLTFRAQDGNGHRAGTFSHTRLDFTKLENSRIV
ncbi:hypothetical protein CEXT_712571 [Caerostris extrusa]|uniref:Uncharacterized protein n=1 Tax=Caerostris extrusa TaxID=172846 RepID=A0AAV4XAR6_CAEEX|nr:hypothetical protein CEXT_712571 [Caerostris extrusa]